MKPKTTPDVNKKKVFISIALIIILGFAVYSNSLEGEFIRDDITLVRDNIYIKSWSGVLDCFRKDIATGGRQKWNSYRPFQMVTYAMDYSIWKLNVKGYHLTNTLLHILVALAIYWFINILYDDKILSLFTSMLFVVSPLHTGAVSYISGRADSLSLLFMLLSFILYIKLINKNDVRLYILMVSSYMLALLSRENSLILPVLLLLYHCSFKVEVKAKVKNFTSILIIAFIYVLFRLTLLKPILSNITYTTTLLERTPGFFVAITNYARLILLPFNLHTNYGVKSFNLNDPKAILGIFILVSSLSYALRKRNTNTLVFFATGWFFITLLTQSNLYPINAYMAEHWLYMPLIGFFLILAKGISLLYRNRRFQSFAVVLMASLLTFSSYLTIKQNDYWKENISFYKRTLEYTPRDYKEYINLGNAYRDIGKHEEAIASYKKAIEINPVNEEAYNNLGVEYYDIGKKEEAIPLFKKAIEIDPDYACAYNSLGLTYYELERQEEAIVSYKKAIELDPDYTSPYYNLGNAYKNMGKIQEAIASYKKVTDIDPNYAKAYNNLGLAYRDIGKKEEAIASYRKAIEIDPIHTGAYNNLAVLYYYEKQYDLAIRYCDRAIELGAFVNPNLLKLLKAHRK